VNNGTCRIIGGKWRGRRITFDAAEGLRPTTDRIRETVFNWLQPYIYQSRCLDMFAGSGVLGIEALSRGAGELVFIEQNKKTAANLKANLSKLGAENAIVVEQDALNWLPLSANRHQQKTFDLVFIDPPFHTDLLSKSCLKLNNSGCLADDAIIYVEQNIDTDIEMPENWVALREKKAGQVAYKLFEQLSVDRD
jgi:16S rRNA (guanine966-N2)-methyltransferase